MQESSTRALVEVLRAEARRRGPGQRLPATRRLVETYRVSPVTVSRALAQLAAEGLVLTRPGAGTFVAERRHAAATDHSWQTLVLAGPPIQVDGLSPLADPSPEDGLLSLATGYLHPCLVPARALGAALSRAARLPDAWERPPTAGLHGLRAWFAGVAGPGIDSRDVLVTSGGQSALSAAFRALVAPGAPLLVESPTYPGALAVARAAGIRPVPVPTDAKGVVPELLAEAFARTGARAFYCQPTYHNPTGATMDALRRADVLAAVSAANAFVVEDDFARWLAHSHRPSARPSPRPPPRPLLAEDPDGRVVYIASLAKAASASLRVGALVARGPVAQRLHALRVVDDLFVPRPMQEAVLDLVSRSAWERHLRELAQALDRRCTTLVRALASELPEVGFVRPAGGMHLWVRLPPGCDDTEVTLRARRAGVVVMAGRAFFPAEAPGPQLRLTFSAAPSEADLVVATRRLATAVRAG